MLFRFQPIEHIENIGAFYLLAPDHLLTSVKQTQIAENLSKASIH